ncbi:MAG TPA: polyprenyl synthetase family protein [Rectinemataceae bacterium]|nr:polyprenyl synthetase family protein [Rectinemataceae bacterium]
MSDSAGDNRAPAFLAGCRAEILGVLERMCRARGLELEAVLPGGAALMERILEYASRGKMLRGSLVYLGAALFGKAGSVGDRGIAVGASSADGLLAGIAGLSAGVAGLSAGVAGLSAGVAEAAAAMELFQAGLLIHDDIMDRDERRRGAPSLHAAYAMEGKKLGAEDPLHLGESLAICAGDVCFFEALRAFSEVAAASAAVGGASSTASSAAAPNSSGGIHSLLALCGSELSVVGLAQMADCRFGELPAEPTEEAILAMYRGKTARYSFSLPFAVGAALAGRDDQRELIFAIGDLAGLAFQLRDDEIGIFSDSETSGKVLGSDIRENKKTVWRSRLLSRVDAEERRRLLAIYGNPAIGAVEVEHVRHLSAALGLRSEMAAWLDDLVSRAKELVSSLEGCDEETRALLVDLVDWLASRKY